MRVELLAVGDELLRGDVVDTNSAWIGRRLAESGLDVAAISVVGDVRVEIAAVVAAALRRADAVIVTGGLGPTPDDLTRAAVTEVVGEIEELSNEVGTAPGMRAESAGGVVYALPGVPHEMQWMLETHVLADLRGRAGAPPAPRVVLLRTAGLRESAVAEALGGLAAGPDVSVAFLVGGGEVQVRFASVGDAAEAAAEQARAVLGDAVYGAAGDTLAGVVLSALRSRGETMAVAESLTGGLLAARLVDVPGASAAFRGGITAYATDLKASAVGVPAELLARHGPVSVEVAAAMATGVREGLDAIWGLAVTGVAGPEPQDGRPVGTLHIGLAGPSGSAVHSVRLVGDRPRIREAAVVAALDQLRRRVFSFPSGEAGWRVWIGEAAR